MAYNTKPIATDKDGNPISQYYNPATDQYEPVEGQSGANKVVLYNSDGTENNSLSLIPILDKLSQLTGTVVDEETRKSNELQRQELYNQILNMLETGQLKGEKGDKGDKGDTGAKGDKGDPGADGSDAEVTKENIETALGYTPADGNDLTNLKYSELSSIATNIDSEGIYQNIEWKRKDNTLYAKSTLIGTTPNYNQIKIDYYNNLGTTIDKTITWNLTYDDNGFIYKKDVI